MRMRMRMRMYEGQSEPAVATVVPGSCDHPSTVEPTPKIIYLSLFSIF